MTMPDESTSDDPKKQSKSSKSPAHKKVKQNTEEVIEEISSEEIVDDILREQAVEEVVNADADVSTSTAESEESEEELAKDPPLKRAGEVLRDARLAKKYTTADVARELMITQTFVEAIEGAIVEKLPSRVYVRGYITSYAEYVDAPKKDVLKLFDRSHEGLEPESSKRAPSISVMRRRDNVRSFLSKNSPKILTALIIATIIGISGVIWYFWTSNAAVSSPSLPEIPNAGLEQTVPTDPAIAEVPEENDPSLDLNQDYENDVGLDESESEVIAIGTVGYPEENPLEGLAIPEDTETSLGVSLSIPVNDASQGELDGREIASDTQDQSLTNVEGANLEPEVDENPIEDALALSENEAKLQRAREEGLPIGSILIELKEECWIEVEDRYGDRIYNDLHHPNDTVLLSGVAPLNVTLGNAKGATMYYNGKKVALRPSVVTGVALVNLR